MSGLDDGILRMFIDEVFDVFDSDRSGQLDVNELHTFLNQLYQQLNQPRRFTPQETSNYMKDFDLSKNGAISKPELFLFFKKLTSGGFQNNYGPQNPQYGQPQYGQPQYGQQGQYGYSGQNQYGGAVQGQVPQQPMYYANSGSSQNMYGSNPYR